MPAAMRGGGARFTGSNLAGLVGQVLGRAALPLILTEALESGAGGAGI